jgi:single-stranded-DNA-specific exonuclease
MQACSHLLENFGGHMYAAGLTLEKDNIEAFGDCFEKVVSETITEEQQVPVIKVDMEISLEDITEKFVRILKQFRPFGPENMAPVFVSRNLYAGPSSRLVGGNGEHIKLELMEESGQNIPGIAFNQSHNSDVIQKGLSFDICYTIEENAFMGRTTLQLNIKDIKASEN